MGMIPVVLAADRRFFRPALQAMRAVAQTAAAGATPAIYLICDWTAAEVAVARAKASALGAAFLAVHPGDLGAERPFPVSAHIPAASYWRLFLARILPADAARAVYLDGDAAPQRCLSALLGTDLRGKALGAVADCGTPWRAPPGVMPTPVRCERPPYFNAGVLLIDLERWRAADTEARLLAYAERHAHALRFHDQDVLNAVFRDAWRALDPRWNVQTSLYHPAWLAAPSIARPARLAMRLDPWIVHAFGPEKPWDAAYDGAARRRFLPLTADGGDADDAAHGDFSFTYRLARGLLSRGRVADAVELGIEAAWMGMRTVAGRASARRYWREALARRLAQD